MAKKRCEIKKGAKLKKLPNNKKIKLIKSSNKKNPIQILKNASEEKNQKGQKKKKHRWISAQFVCMLHLQFCVTVIFVSIFSN